MPYYLSILINIVISVVLDEGRGCANLPTAIKFWLSSYNPTVVMYGAKYDPVVKLYGTSSELPDNNVLFWEKLNSLSRIVHLYWVSNIGYELINEHVTFDEVTNVLIISTSLTPYEEVPSLVIIANPCG